MAKESVYVSFIKRNHYFHGKVLTAKDFADEQHYLREKQRLRNLNLLGSGVVSGLQVSANGQAITVTPGMALDGHGREIMLTVPATLKLPKERSPRWVVVKYAERPADPVPVLGVGDETMEPSRIEEGVEISYASENPCGPKTSTPAELEWIAIAKVVWKGNAWRVAKGLPCRRVGLRT
jgi:hypothetical protein